MANKSDYDPVREDTKKMNNNIMNTYNAPKKAFEISPNVLMLYTSLNNKDYHIGIEKIILLISNTVHFPNY